MDDTQLYRTLEKKIEALLELLQNFERDNKLLRSQQTHWQQERSQLLQKNELARNRVEAMITRLRALEQDT